MPDLQRMGGLAGLIMAATFVVAFAVLGTVFFPSGYLDPDTEPEEKVAILADNQPLVSLSYLIGWVVWGLFQVVLALALYDRVKDGAPALARPATAIGLIWAALVIASGLVFNLGIRTVVDLHASDPAQAGALWSAIEPVAEGLGGGGGEILGGVWLLLIGTAALRAEELPKALNYLGLGLGVAGVLTLIPPLEAVVFVFGSGLIVWFAGVGAVMLRDARTPSAEEPAA